MNTYQLIEDAVESEIRAAFAEHGTVQKVQMPLNRETVSDVLDRFLLFVVIFNLLDTLNNNQKSLYRDAPVALHSLPCPVKRSILPRLMH